jgi:alanine transaminase
MIPIPQYPLYTAALTLYGGTAAPYYLNEENGWQLDVAELDRSIEFTRAQGKTVKAIVVINPGNPTGAIFSADTIKKIIEFAVKNRLIIIADEVILDIPRFTDKTFTSRMLSSTLSAKCSKP